MGDYVCGSGEVTLKKELSAVSFSQVQEGLKKKKDDLDMVELMFRIGLDATNESSIIEISEGTDSWNEEDTLEILAYLVPYITEGCIIYFDEDEREYWRYVYSPLSEKWEREEGRIEYGPVKQYKTNSSLKVSHKSPMTIEDVLSVTGGNTKITIIGWADGKEDRLWTGIVDKYNFEYAPYGHQEVKHLSVTNKDISKDGNDILYIYFDYPKLSTEDKGKIEELKKYFYFCDFPEGGVEQIYYRYGKNTEEYIKSRSMSELLSEYKECIN